MTHLDDLTAELERLRPGVDRIRASLEQRPPERGLASCRLGTVSYFEAAERLIEGARDAGYPDCDERLKAVIDALSLAPVTAMVP